MGTTIMAGSVRDYVSSYKDQTITGTKTFEGSGSTSPVIFKNSSPNPVTQWQNSVGEVRGTFYGNGVFESLYLAAGTRIVGTTVSATSPGTTTKGIVMRAAPGQSVSLGEFQDSAGVALTTISHTGNIVTQRDYIGRAAYFQDTTNEFYNSTVNIKPLNADSKGFTVRGMPGQNGHLGAFQNDAGTVVASISATGRLNASGLEGAVDIVSREAFFGGADWQGASVNVFPRSTGEKGIVIKGLAGQSANLMEFQNSTGGAFLTIGSSALVIDGRQSLADSERLVIYASSGQTQKPFQIRNSASAEMLGFGVNGGLNVLGNGYAEFGPNASWGAFLRVGGNNSQPAKGRAAIAASDGNIHIDPATEKVNSTSGSGVYFNWYATNTQGIYFGNGTAGTVGRIDGAGNASFTSWTSTSSRETKNDIRAYSSTGPNDEQFLALGAVSYVPKSDKRGVRLHSLIAEEAYEVMPEIVSLDEEGNPGGINMTSLVTILMSQVQNLTERVKSLEA